MCKIGETVNVCFDGTLEMEELCTHLENAKDSRMCRVTFRMPDGRYCVALVAKEFVN